MAVFRAERPVRFGDCDPAGIAYFPAYIDILVGVVEDFWSALGFPWSDQLGGRHMGTPTAHLSCDFVRPSRHGDTLLFTIAVTHIGRSSLTLAIEVTRKGERIWTAKQVLVAMDMTTGTSQPWPDDIRAAIEAFVAAPEAPPETAQA